MKKKGQYFFMLGKKKLYFKPYVACDYHELVS